MSFISLGPSNPNVVSGDYWASGNQSVLMSGAHNVYLPLMPQNGAEVTVVGLDSTVTIVPQDVETITVAGQTGLTSWAVKAGQDCTLKYMRGNRTWYRVGTSDSGAAGVPGLTVVTVSSGSSYSANAGEFVVWFSMTNGSQVNLPPAVNVGDQVRVLVAQGPASGVMIAPNGPAFDMIQSAVSSYGFPLFSGSAVLLQVGSYGVWEVVSDAGLSNLQPIYTNASTYTAQPGQMIIGNVANTKVTFPPASLTPLVGTRIRLVADRYSLIVAGTNTNVYDATRTLIASDLTLAPGQSMEWYCSYGKWYVVQAGGAPGPTGPQGAAGPAGPVGPAGQGGLFKLVYLATAAAYSAQPGDAVVVDYPTTPVVVTLPKQPVAGTMIRVVAMGTGGASLKAQNPDLLMDDLENSGTWALGRGSSVILLYDASNQAWWPIDHGLSRVPLAADRYQKIVRTAADYTTSSTADVAIDSTNLRITKTCNNRPIRLHLRACGVIASVALASAIFSFRMDGAVIDGGIQLYQYAAVASQQYAINLAWDVAPQTGSHYFEPWWRGNNASAVTTMYARSNLPMQFTWEELPYGP